MGKKIKVIRVCILVAFISLLTIILLLTCQNNKTFKKIINKQNDVYEIYMALQEIPEEKFRQEEAETGIKHVGDELSTEFLLEKVVEIQEELERLRRDVNRQSERIRDEEIFLMLTERFVNDYTEKGLNYFNESDYEKASIAFDMALKYQQNNTTLLFYQTYATYLSYGGRIITGNRLTDMQKKVREMQDRGFREEEQIYYTVEEMERRINEIGYNINLDRMQRMIKHESISETQNRDNKITDGKQVMDEENDYKEAEE